LGGIGLYIRGNGDVLGDIVDYLDSKGVKTSRGKKFSKQAVRNILKKRYYIGGEKCQYY